MKKAKRTRNNVILLRMNDEEYKTLKSRISKSGQTQQAYLLAAVEGIKCATPEEIELLRHINDTISGIYKNMRGIGTNINQMAKHANEMGYTEAKDIRDARIAVQEIQSEVHPIWQSLRLLIQRLQGTHH